MMDSRRCTATIPVQNGVTNVVTQSQPSLASGSYDTGAVKALLDTANSSAQSALDRANK